MFFHRALPTMRTVISNVKRYLTILLLLTLALPLDANELYDLLNEAAQHSPALLAAKWRVEQQLLRHQELQEFFDPSLYMAAGQAERARSLPGASGYTNLANNATELQAGIDMPLDPGIYVAVGAAERLYNDIDGYDYLAQTLFGIKIRVPLLKDRGFAKHNLEREMALADYNAAVNQMLDAAQVLKREVTLAYIAAYEALSSYEVTKDATNRFQQLVSEARELYRLKVIPEYQIYDAQMDLQIGKENEEVARNRMELSLISLAALVGGHRKIKLQSGSDILFKIASETKALPELPLAEAFENRGSYQQIKNSIEYVRAQLASTLEDQKDDVTLHAGLSWQGEIHDDFGGSYRHITDRNVGADITVVWKRPLDYRGPRARKARFDARINQLKENLRAEAIAITRDIQHATNNFKTALTRIEIVSQGIQASERTVTAERERFRLGEGTSSSVTDAQKELTSLQHKRTSAAADLLRAKANFLFASGYNGNE
jgi:outer membrane protein TolC